MHSYNILSRLPNKALLSRLRAHFLGTSSSIISRCDQTLASVFAHIIPLQSIAYQAESHVISGHAWSCVGLHRVSSIVLEFPPGLQFEAMWKARAIPSGFFMQARPTTQLGTRFHFWRWGSVPATWTSRNWDVEPMNREVCSCIRAAEKCDTSMPSVNRPSLRRQAFHASEEWGRTTLKPC